MRAPSLVMCCWPGLPRLWLLGDWSALVIAVSFGGVLNLLLVSAFVRTDWLPFPANELVWIAVGGLWLVSAIRAYRKLPDLCKPATAADDRGLFLQAQNEYLQGHWFEAESALREMLRVTPGDFDARLLLATLFRRTRRYDEALSELGRVAQQDGAEKWHWEIATERRLVHESCKSLDNETAVNDTAVNDAADKKRSENKARELPGT